MNVIIPVLPGSISVTVVGTVDILSRAEELFQERCPGQASPASFCVRLMSITSEPVVADANGFPITCSTRLSDNPAADLVVVPGLRGIPDVTNETHVELVTWLRAQYARGATLCSVCTGAFFVAATGWLDKQEATVSWFAAEAFRAQFPRVRVKDERLLIDNGRVVTSGASTSFINLCVYLIEKHYGPSLGNYCAKLFLVNKGAQSQRAYAIFSHQKAHQDEAIKKAQSFIEDHITEKLTVRQVLEQVALSERSFIRRFKSATGMAPLEYIQRTKVEYAKRQLEEESTSVKEISYSTGYADLNYFRSTFKRYTGLTPLAYRRQYSFGI